MLKLYAQRQLFRNGQRSLWFHSSASASLIDIKGQGLNDFWRVVQQSSALKEAGHSASGDGQGEQNRQPPSRLLMFMACRKACCNTLNRSQGSQLEKTQLFSSVLT